MSRVWSREETNTLLKIVEDLPELWDGTHADYKDRVKKALAKERLAAIFSTSALEIHRKLHNIRTQVNNELRKVTKKAHCKITWEFFDAAKFILSTRKINRPQEILEASHVSSEPEQNLKSFKVLSIKARGFAPDNAGSRTSQFEESSGKWFDYPGSSTSRNIEIPVCSTNNFIEDPGCSSRQYIEDSTGSSSQFNENPGFSTCPDAVDPNSSAQQYIENPASNTSQFIENPGTGSTSNFMGESDHARRKRKRKDEILEKALDIMNKPDDDFQHFGNFVASSLRNLRSELRQRQMKRKIQTLILEIEELDEFDQMSRNSNLRC